MLQEESKFGRKPVADKKQPVRFFIEQSVIDAAGGIEKCKEICAEYLKQNKNKIKIYGNQ